MLLEQLFHWSPADRFDSISQQGLIPGSFHVTCTEPQTVIFLSPDPRTAWELSGAVGTARDWDLWQVTVDDDDEIHIRAEFGPRVQEVRIHNPIPPGRLFHLARRLTTFR